jgi:3-methyl-2-oxobutanoate hydroxymethyltransferase
MRQDMQLERIEGFKEFIAEVQNGKFPEKKHIIEAPSGLIEGFLAKI